MHLRGSISISPSMDYLEQAFDDAKYGEFSRHPYMDVLIPSLIDPGMAPPGQHVMSCFVQYAPYNLKGGWTDAQRTAFGDTVVNTLCEYAPNLRENILHRPSSYMAHTAQNSSLHAGPAVPYPGQSARE